MQKENEKIVKINKSYRLGTDTIEKISEIKNEIFKKSQKNISYAEIVESAFKYAGSTELVEFIIKENQ